MLFPLSANVTGAGSASVGALVTVGGRLVAVAGMLVAVGGKLVAIGGIAVGDIADGVMFVMEALLLPQPATIATSNDSPNAKVLNRMVLLCMM